MKKIAVVMGSDSDLPVVRKALDALDEFGVEYETHVYSAHRTPDEAASFALNAEKNGFGVIIAAAGMAAHLAGAMAARSILPVIGVPVKTEPFGGLDSLLSTVQTPPGVPVAAVAVDGAKNAALLAIEILAVEDKALARSLEAFRRKNAEETLRKDARLNNKSL